MKYLNKKINSALIYILFFSLTVFCLEAGAGTICEKFCHEETVGCDSVTVCEEQCDDVSEVFELVSAIEVVDQSNVVISSTENDLNTLTDTESGTGLFVWKGFSQEWLRTVVGFKIPHRISKLDNYIETVGSNSAAFHMGQKTGVDGNFMKPEGYYQYINSDMLNVKNGTCNLKWTDINEGAGDVPEANSNITVLISIPAADLTTDNYSVFLDGFSLNTSCPENTDCNSDGMWPYTMNFDITPLNEMAAGYYQFALDVKLYRAWTPNYGGIPLIEEKPYTENLDFDLSIHYSVVNGKKEKVKSVAGPTININGKLRSDTEYSGSNAIAGFPGISKAATLITGFGFVLSPHSTDKKFERRGRYIGKMKYGISGENYNAVTGTMNFNYALHVWVPDTVCQSNIDYTLKTSLLQVAEADTVTGTETALGSICCNSTDQAPFFTAWKECGKANKGPEQDEVTVPIVITD